MKTQITKTIIDLTELNERIKLNDCFRNEDKDSYESSIVLMNQITLDFLIEATLDCVSSLMHDAYREQMKSNPVYKGHRIFIDETLKLGEVDIR